MGCFPFENKAYPLFSNNIYILLNKILKLFSLILIILINLIKKEFYIHLYINTILTYISKRTSYLQIR